MSNGSEGIAEYPGRPDWEPCGLGICAANAGHEGTCAEASGWVDEDGNEDSTLCGFMAGGDRG